MKQYYKYLDDNAINDIEKIIKEIPLIEGLNQLNDLKKEVLILFALSYKYNLYGQVFGFVMEDAGSNIYLALDQLLVMVVLDLKYAYQHNKTNKILASYNMFYSIWHMKARYHVDLNPLDLIENSTL